MVISLSCTVACVLYFEVLLFVLVVLVEKERGGSTFSLFLDPLSLVFVCLDGRQDSFLRQQHQLSSSVMMGGVAMRRDGAVRRVVGFALEI